MPIMKEIQEIGVDFKIAPYLGISFINIVYYTKFSLFQQLHKFPSHIVLFLHLL